MSVTELPKALIKDDKFGLYLRDFVKVCLGGDDEPTDTGITILTIQLIIDDTIEPKWNVITNRTDPKPISQKERRLLSPGMVGSDHEKDFQWGRGSILQKYADSREALHSAFTQAMRSAVENTNLEALDQMAPTVEEVGKRYGVGFNGTIHNRLLMQNGSYSTTVGIEEQLFQDSSIPCAEQLIAYAVEIKGIQSVEAHLNNEFKDETKEYRVEDEAIGGMTKTKLDEGGVYGDFTRWMDALNTNTPIYVDDIEKIKDSIKIAKEDSHRLRRKHEEAKSWKRSSAR